MHEPFMLAYSYLSFPFHNLFFPIISFLSFLSFLLGPMCVCTAARCYGVVGAASPSNSNHRPHLPFRRVGMTRFTYSLFFYFHFIYGEHTSCSST